MNELVKEELCGNGSIVKTVHADWEELVKMVHHAFAYGLQCNDMTHGEVMDDIAFALDKFAKAYGLPEHDWEAEYEDLYANESCSD